MITSTEKKVRDNDTTIKLTLVANWVEKNKRLGFKGVVVANGRDVKVKCHRREAEHWGEGGQSRFIDGK